MGTLLLFFLLLLAVIAGSMALLDRFGGSRSARYQKAGRAMEPFLFILPTFLLLFLLFCYPLFNSFIMAFENYKLTAPYDIYFNGLENFRNLFSASEFGLLVRNSLSYVVFSVLGQFLLGMTLALALRKKFRGRGVYQAIVFLPWSFSGFVIGILFRWSFNGEYGVVNDLLLRLGVLREPLAWLGTPGLSLLVVICAMIWMGVPFFAIMNLASLQSIPEEIYEAADIDGCGMLRKFFSITLPYIKPTVIMTLLLRTIWIFNSFDLIVVITNGGPANYSQTLPSYMYVRAFSSYDFGLAAAVGILLMAVLAVYTVFFLRVTNYNKAGDF